MIANSYHSSVRFCKEDMVRLYAALNIHDKYTCPQGTTAVGMEALMLML